jgi:hypothetical protein
MQSRRRRRGAATSFISFLCLLLSTVIFFFLSLGRLQLSFGCSVLHFSLAFSSFFRAETADRRMRDGFCCVCSPLFLTVLLFAACVWGLYVRRCALTCPSSPPPSLSLALFTRTYKRSFAEHRHVCKRRSETRESREKKWYLVSVVVCFYVHLSGVLFSSRTKKRKISKGETQKKSHRRTPPQACETRTHTHTVGPRP